MKLAVKMKTQDDGSFKAWVPALPGCVAYGETRKDALEKIQKAINNYLGALASAMPPPEDGRPR